MARNPIRFQKGISLNEFLSLYGAEQQCFDALYQSRWPSGFVCPNCGHDRGCQLTTHKLQQCYRCHRQTSITAGTIFEATKLPLTVWFQGIYFMTQGKKGGSARTLHRQLGLSYNAAWRMRHKLMQVMMERDREPPPRRVGPTRRCLSRGRAKRRQARARRAGQDSVRRRRRDQRLSAGTEVRSDGLACFSAVTEAGCVHEPVVTGGGKAAVERPEFRWVNTILGNVKNALCGTYHAVRPKYAQRYLAEFEYRFNRRFDLPDIIPRLVYVALRTPPMPERLLKLNLA